MVGESRPYGFKVVRGDLAWPGMTDGNPRRVRVHFQVLRPGSMMSPCQYWHTQSNGLGTVACTYCVSGLSSSLGLWRSQTLAHRPQRQEVEEVGPGRGSCSRLQVPASRHGTWDGWRGGYLGGAR